MRLLTFQIFGQGDKTEEMGGKSVLGLNALGYARIVMGFTTAVSDKGITICVLRCKLDP